MSFANTGLGRTEVDAMTGAVLIVFGADECGHCQAAQPLVTAAMADFRQVRLIQVEDGRGRPLGRSFKVKLWPTLIFLRDGLEAARLVRPVDAETIRDALRQIVL